MSLTQLIDKRDNFEVIRDRIAEILLVESANQVALATAALKPDPSLWALKVYTERSDPWATFVDGTLGQTPRVNVWVDSLTYDKSKSDPIQTQLSDGVFNIDCYGYGLTALSGSGQSPGDQEAALVVQRAVRLVRNILMAAENTYLGLRGTVGLRWPQGVNFFQPAVGQSVIPNVMAARIALAVSFNEFSPQVDGDILEYVAVTARSAEDGEVVFLADFDYS